jgi:hypothetical protein
VPGIYLQFYKPPSSVCEANLQRISSAPPPRGSAPQFKVEVRTRPSMMSSPLKRVSTGTKISETIDIAFFDNDSSNQHSLYPGFKPGNTLLKHGHVNIPGALPLPCDILWERDIAVPMRDGVKIYIDVYRPPNAKQGTIPAIIAGGPFGKNGGVNRFAFGQAPWRNGVPQRSVSSFEKFEGPDPAYWCNHGYAIVHPGESSQYISSYRPKRNLALRRKFGDQLYVGRTRWIRFD